MKAKMIVAAGLLVSALLAGCSIGPRTLKRDYPRYSQAIRDIEDEHLLLNVVRLRYMETPVFLQISGITTTYGVDFGASTSATKTSGEPSSGAVGIGAGYRESPTVTYSLPDSREFFGRMLAPLSTEQVAPLAMSGIGGFFRMGLRRINRLENVSSGTGWRATEPGSYLEFQEAMTLLEELERVGLIDVTFNIARYEASSPFDDLGEHASMPAAQQLGMEFWKNEDDRWIAFRGKRTPFLRFSGAAADDPRALRLRELLNLDPQKHSFPVVDVDFSRTEIARIRNGEPAAAFDPEAKFGEIVVVNRSMLEILGLASTSVQVPDEHLQAGLVDAIEDVLGDRLTIRNSAEEPTNAAVAVQHGGTWFYIAASDLHSKMTLVRLNSLFEVTAGRVGGTQPILTIPVN